MNQIKILMTLYLSSYEYNDFEEPKTVLQYHKTIMSGRNFLIVEIDKPLIGQKYGLSGNLVTKFYLVNRVDETAFDKLSRFPVDVHLLIVKNPENLNPSTLEELQNIAWACLYGNEEAAKNHKIA